MSSNYQWQQHQANERIQARLKEAEQHRSAKQENGRETFSPLKIMIPGLIIVIVALWLLTNCTTNTSLTGSAVRPYEYSPNLTIVEPISFQDEREAIYEIGRKDYNADVMKMAARIHFQDDEERHSTTEETVVELQKNWTMADRIRFQEIESHRVV
jgi:preprotein translocase subunit SecY